MQQLARHLLLVSFVFLAALVAPAVASAVAPVNDSPGTTLPLPAAGGSMDSYTSGATMEPGYASYASLGTWGWSMWYSWTAPMAGQARLDLCQTPQSGDDWYLAAWDLAEGPSPLSYDVAASSGCAGSTMPQGDFTAVPGKTYLIAVGSHTTQNVLMFVRVTYLPKVATVPTITGSATVGQSLVAHEPTWSTDASKHSLGLPTFERCAADGTGCTPIVNLGRPSYQVQAADLGRRIVVSYTASNAAGDVTTRSIPTAVVADRPVDADGDGIPDELATTLGLPTGTAGYDELCTRFTLCKDDGRQSSIFASWNSMNVIDGALLDALLGTVADDLLVSKQDQDAALERLRCNGGLGDDVCIGSPARDTCIAIVGDDYCLGARGNDTCLSRDGNDVCYGGEGADACFVQPVQVAGLRFPAVPKATCSGGPGADMCIVNAPPGMRGEFSGLPNMTCEGGAANDTCKAMAAKLVAGLKLTTAGVVRMKCAGGAGNDRCGGGRQLPAQLQSLVRIACNGGVGNDLCVASGATAWATGVLGAANSLTTCIGGPGNDTLWTLNGLAGDRINGGGQPGDICFADPGDTVLGCAQVIRWGASRADLALINGTNADLEQFAIQSKVTLNDGQLSIDDAAALAAQVNDIAGQLNLLVAAQTDQMRSLLDALNHA